MSFYSQISFSGNLYRGWQKVESNDGAPGVDGVSINEFDLNLEKNLSLLERELAGFTYKPQALLRYDIPKANGKIRSLAVPTVRERVAQSSALIVLGPVIEREFEKCSFAYRPGLSRITAIEHIRQLRNEGFLWIVDADIESFFDNVNHSLLIRRFKELIPEKETVALIEKWIKCDVVHQGRRYKRRKGLPQGAVISPMLANLYLDKFDEALLKKGLKLVRYADDFIILCKSKPKAEEALKLSEAALNDLELQLNPEKTGITSFDQGFKYLGALFLKSIILLTKMQEKETLISISKPEVNLGSMMQENENKIQEIERKTQEEKVTEIPNFASYKKVLESSVLGSALLNALEEKGMALEEFLASQGGEVQPPSESREVPPAAPNVSPFMRTLYIQEQGCWLRIEGEKFIVATGGEKGMELLELPTLKIEQILIFGSCLITPAAMRYCLTHNIPIMLLSSRGNYFGRIESTIDVNIELERLQFLRSLDPQFILDISKRIVEAKLNNTKTLLQRHHQKTRKAVLSKAIDQLTQLQHSLPKGGTLDEVRGYEGRGSAVYFDVFDELFEVQDFQFVKRVKRPPTDPVNAMLSFGYTLLFNNIFSMVRLHRLNPYVGFFHSDKPNHPALVSDLIEEFRCIVEGMVVGIVNKRILKPEDFYHVQVETAGDEEESSDESRDQGCFLTDEARKKFIHEFEQLMQRETTHPTTGYTVNYRRCLDLQVQNFAQHLRGEKPYTPFMRR